MAKNMAKYIKCYYMSYGDTSFQLLTAKEIVEERARFRKEASEVLNKCEDPSIRHMLYYSDRRRDDDMIWMAIFYIGLVGLTDEEFYRRTEDVGNDGFMGVGHKMD